MHDSTSFSTAARSLIEGWPLYDNAIVRHGFVPHMRDYELEVIACAPNGSPSYPEGRYRLVFTHCVVANIATCVKDETWPISWDDVFTDYPLWERAGYPEGYVWGVNHMVAYPGARCIMDSLLAAEWSRRLVRPMHEVRIETNVHDLTLVFHVLRAYRIARGDPDTGELLAVEPVDLLGAAT